MTQSRKIRNGFKSRIPSIVRRSYVVVEDALRLRFYQPSHLKFWLRDFGARSSVRDFSWCRVTRPVGGVLEEITGKLLRSARSGPCVEL